MKMKALALAAVLALAVLPAMAQQLSEAETDTTVGTASALCVPAGGKQTLTLWNLSATATIYYSENAGTPVATANTAGSFPIGPASYHFWPRGSAPTAAINCISTATGTTVTAMAGY